LGEKYLKFFDADPDSESGPGSGIFLTLDPRWEKFGFGINIPICNTGFLFLKRVRTTKDTVTYLQIKL
jgi:hypothetical protein